MIAVCFQYLGIHSHYIINLLKKHKVVNKVRFMVRNIETLFGTIFAAYLLEYKQLKI